MPFSPRPPAGETRPTDLRAPRSLARTPSRLRDLERQGLARQDEQTRTRTGYKLTSRFEHQGRDVARSEPRKVAHITHADDTTVLVLAEEFDAHFAAEELSRKPGRGERKAPVSRVMEFSVKPAGAGEPLGGDHEPIERLVGVGLGRIPEMRELGCTRRSAEAFRRLEAPSQN